MSIKNPWESENSGPQIDNPWMGHAVPPGDNVFQDNSNEPIAPITPGSINRTDFFEAMRRNRRNTWMLIFGMLFLAGFFGYVLGWGWDTAFGGVASSSMQYMMHGQVDWMRLVTTPSETGIMLGIALLAGMAMWTMLVLWRGDKMVLGMTDAEYVSENDMPQLHNIVEEMALAAGLPKPKIVVLPTHVPNAFATGLRSDNATVGVTMGLMSRLNRREVQGVIAHEMGHVLNGDMRYATIMAVMTGVLVFAAEIVLRFRGMLYYTGSTSDGRRRGGNPLTMVIMLVVFLIAAILVPILARLIQMAISRQREYLADATAVQLTRDPGGLIAALQKISVAQEPVSTMKSSLEPLFIVTPQRLLHNGNNAWFSTHPPIEKRIERLKSLE